MWNAGYGATSRRESAGHRFTWDTGKKIASQRRMAMLAQELPADAVDVIAGGHDWRTWTRLWENFLEARFNEF